MHTAFLSYALVGVDQATIRAWFSLRIYRKRMVALRCGCGKVSVRNAATIVTNATEMILKRRRPFMPTGDVSVELKFHSNSMFDICALVGRTSAASKKTSGVSALTRLNIYALTLIAGKGFLLLDLISVRASAIVWFTLQGNMHFQYRRGNLMRTSFQPGGFCWNDLAVVLASWMLYHIIDTVGLFRLLNLNLGLHILCIYILYWFAYTLDACILSATFFHQLSVVWYQFPNSRSNAISAIRVVQWLCVVDWILLIYGIEGFETATNQYRLKWYSPNRTNLLNSQIVPMKTMYLLDNFAR